MSTTYYVWDEENDSLLEEIDENGNVISATAVSGNPHSCWIIMFENVVDAFGDDFWLLNRTSFYVDDTRREELIITGMFGENIRLPHATVGKFQVDNIDVQFLENLRPPFVVGDVVRDQEDISHGLVPDRSSVVMGYWSSVHRIGFILF